MHEAKKEREDMSRIAEALAFDTDEERLAWFYSLSEKERADVVNDAREMADKFIVAFMPVADVMREFCERAGSILQKALADCINGTYK